MGVKGSGEGHKGYRAEEAAVEPNDARLPLCSAFAPARLSTPSSEKDIGEGVWRVACLLAKQVYCGDACPTAPRLLQPRDSPEIGVSTIPGGWRSGDYSK
eukprot:275954-Pleurochrysis_carterae.AAC.4